MLGLLPSTDQSLAFLSMPPVASRPATSGLKSIEEHAPSCACSVKTGQE
jgi:hypothetical protein